MLFVSQIAFLQISNVKAQRNADLGGGFSTFEWNGFNITIVSSWELIQNETDYDGDGVPDVISTVTFFNDTLMEIYVDDTRETGAYKWACAVINITGFDKVGKWEYNPATDVWTYTGLLNYGYLPYYGLPYEWANETGGYGFIVFGAGSGDKWYRLNFTAGYKEFKIYTGKGSEIISVKPKKIKYSNNEGFHSLDVEVATLKPKFTLYRWSREAFIELQLPNAVSKRRSFRDDMLTQKYDGFEAVYYPRSDIGEYGSFEFEIVFENKPSFNSITFNVNFTNLKFYYQPPLYEEYGFSEPFNNSTFSVNATHVMRLINGTWINEAYRPENVVGSYAVYHAYKMHNEYKTGKAFHIYRPKLIDAEGNEAWCRLNISNNLLKIEIPQDFLDRAVYPVVIDPTFGYETKGGTAEQGGKNALCGSWFTCPESGTAESITLYVEQYFAATPHIKCAIYKKADGSLVGHTEEWQLTSGYDDWKTFNIISGGNLQGNVDYWLMFWQDSLIWTYTDSETEKGACKSVTYNGWPDPLTGLNIYDRKYSIYCTYTAGGGATEVTVTDSISLSDSVLRNKALTIADSIGTSDSILGDKSLDISDMIQLLEEILRDKALPIIDSANLSDLALIHKSLQITDVIQLIEQILKLTGAGIVGTSSTQYAILSPCQRKVFFANGRFWVWYSDGTDMGYRTSTNGNSWSDFNSVRACDNGNRFSIWFDGTYVHYAYADQSKIYYRRGTPNSDGSITWSAPEQEVSTTFNSALFPHISVDSDGYVWVGYIDRDNYYSKGFVIKSGNNNGTWGTTPSGFPYQVSTSELFMDRVVPTPLTGGKMLVTYQSCGNPVHAKRWDGSSWGEERSVGHIGTAQAYHSAVAEGDDVHIVYQSKYGSPVIYRFYYAKYDYSSNDFTSDVLIADDVPQYSAPVLCRTSQGDLYCFWAENNHIYYKKCHNGTWDSDPTDWIDETSEGLTKEERITVFYNDYNSKIGLAYMTKTSSPYNVKFAYLTTGILKVITDALSLADQILCHKAFSASDIIQLIEKITIDKIFSMNDTIQLLDEILRSKSLVVPDAISITDVVNVITQIFKMVTDSIGSTDQIIIDKNLTISDLIQVSAEQVLRSKSFTITDLISISDAIIVLKEIIKSIMDNVGLSDEILSHKVFTIPDAIQLTEQLLRGKNFAVSDSISLSDVVSLITEIIKSVFDSISLSDEALSHKGFFILDNISLLEQILRHKHFSIQDCITLNEEILRNKLLEIQDQISLLESVITSKLFIIADQISLTDAIQIVQIIKTIHDALKLTEKILAHKKLVIQDQIKLLDVITIIGLITKILKVTLTEFLPVKIVSQEFKPVTVSTEEVFE